MLSEDDLEQQCLKWFAEQDWEVLHGPDIAPDGDNPLRASFHDVFLRPVMLEQLQTINPHLPVSVLEEVILRITRPKPGSGRQQQSIPSPVARRRTR
jgi:type I restriction enzyme R subunit